MTTPAPEADKSTLDDVREKARVITEIGAGLGVLFLVIAWPVALIVYRHLGCSPTEVGVDAQWLIVRAVAAALVLIVVGSSFVALPIALGIDTRVPLLCIFTALMLGVDFKLLFTRESGLYGSIFFGVLIFGILFIAAYLVLKLVIDIRKLPWPDLKTRIVSISIILATSLAILPWATGRAVVSSLDEGRNFNIDFGLNLSIWSIEKRRLIAVNPSITEIPSASCVFYIGAGNGLVYVYDWQTRTRLMIPAAAVIMKSDESC